MRMAEQSGNQATTGEEAEMRKVTLDETRVRDALKVIRGSMQQQVPDLRRRYQAEVDRVLSKMNN
jgi:hypothetical protein